MGENTKSKKLTRKDLFSMAIGNIIGVGIMTMTGIAIGFTGRSVNIAFLVAGLITIISAIPQVYIGGTANFKGGQYSQIAVLGNKKLAGIYIYLQIMMAVAISMYTLSFADYFISIIPGANVKLISLVVLTLLFCLHLIGTKEAARLQNVLCVILALAIAAYIACGITHIQPGYFSNPGFMTDGATGFLMACIYLSFAAGGATFIVNYSAESENPTKDIPFVIIASTAAIVVVYAIMATIAAGSIPVEEAANMPLSVSAVTFMPKSIYTFFVVGGAMFALLTTLNFSIGMLVQPVLVACNDGWLPKSLAKRNKKFGTAHIILICLYIMSIFPIVCGMDITTVANSTAILTTAIRGIICFIALSLPKKMPELWNKSALHVSDTKLKVISWVGIVCAVISVILLFVTSDPAQLCCNGGMLLIALILVFARHKKVNLSTGYSEL